MAGLHEVVSSTWGTYLLSIHGSQLLSQILRLLVTLHVLEAESHLDATEEAVHFLIALGEVGGRTDEALFAAQLAERSTADTGDVVFEDRIGDTLDDGLDVVFLLRLADVGVLGADKVSSLLEHVLHDVVELLVLEHLVDVLESLVVAVVGSSGVAGVDGVELALNVRLEILDVVHALDGGRVAGLEGLRLDAPLVEILDLDVHALAFVLQRHNPVNSRIGEAGLVLDVRLAVVGELLLDEAAEGVCGADGVLAGDDGDWLLLLAGVDAFGDGLRDEFEDVGPNGAGDYVRGGNLLDHLEDVSPQSARSCSPR